MINLTISDALIIAIITSIASIIVAHIENNRRSKADEIKEAKRQQFQDDRDDYFDEQLDIIRKKLDEHNHYAKKFEEVNINITKLSKDIEYILKERRENDKISKSAKKRKKA